MKSGIGCDLMKALKYLIVVFVVFTLIVLPAQAAWPFDDVTAAVNEVIVPWLKQFLSNLIGLFVPILMFILYPIIIILNLIYNIVSVLYTNMAMIYNFLIEIPNYASAMFSAWLPSEFPSVWTAIFLLSIGLATFKRAMRFIEYIKKWIPIIFG